MTPEPAAAIYLSLYDGFRPEPVVMVQPPLAELAPGCANDRHCAAHCGGGGEPFYCCRCGAAFMPKPKPRVHPDVAAYEAEVYKQGRNARVAKRGGLKASKSRGAR